MSSPAYTGIRYYAVRTNPRCERRAQLGLQAEGFGVYLPVETRWRKLPARLYTRAKRENRPKERAEHPLMPGYLFVQIRDEFAKVRAIHGVESLVGINGTPTVIPAGFIEELRRRQEEGEFDHTAPPPPTYAKDETIRVKSGQWQGWVGKFMTESPEGRVRMMFEGKFIHGEQEFDAEQVERAA